MVTSPWQWEPVHDEGQHRGISWSLERKPEMLHWCGYVHIPPGHPWHGKSDAEAPLWDVSVHGGITWAALDDDGIHWKVGFDCAHAFDLIPGVPGMDRPGLGCTYRDIDYARTEALRLAEQAADAVLGVRALKGPDSDEEEDNET